MNNELERIWYKEVVAYSKVLSRHLPAGTFQKTQKDLCEGRVLAG
jgi:hypothetical protein